MRELDYTFTCAPDGTKITSPVWEANVFRHNGGPITGAPLTPRYHTAGVFEGFQGGEEEGP